MAGKDIIMATQEELKKAHIVRKAIEKSITQQQAADILDLTNRQIRRIVARIRLEGETMASYIACAAARLIGALPIRIKP